MCNKEFWESMRRMNLLYQINFNDPETQGLEEINKNLKI